MIFTTNDIRSLYPDKKERLSVYGILARNVSTARRKRELIRMENGNTMLRNSIAYDTDEIREQFIRNLKGVKPGNNRFIPVWKKNLQMIDDIEKYLETLKIKEEEE